MPVHFVRAHKSSIPLPQIQRQANRLPDKIKARDAQKRVSCGGDDNGANIVSLRAQAAAHVGHDYERWKKTHSVGLRKYIPSNDRRQDHKNFRSLRTKDCFVATERDLLSRGKPGRSRTRSGDGRIPFCQRAETVAGAVRGSPSATHAFGSDCDCRFTKR
jgi:hypothetical protein